VITNLLSGVVIKIQVLIGLNPLEDLPNQIHVTLHKANILNGTKTLVKDKL